MLKILPTKLNISMGSLSLSNYLNGKEILTNTFQTVLKFCANVIFLQSKKTCTNNEKETTKKLN